MKKTVSLFICFTLELWSATSIVVASENPSSLIISSNNEARNTPLNDRSTKKRKRPKNFEKNNRSINKKTSIPTHHIYRKNQNPFTPKRSRTGGKYYTPSRGTSEKSLSAFFISALRTPSTEHRYKIAKKATSALKRTNESTPKRCSPLDFFGDKIRQDLDEQKADIYTIATETTGKAFAAYLQKSNATLEEQFFDISPEDPKLIQWLQKIKRFAMNIQNGNNSEYAFGENYNFLNNNDMERRSCALVDVLIDGKWTPYHYRPDFLLVDSDDHHVVLEFKDYSRRKTQLNLSNDIQTRALIATAAQWEARAIKWILFDETKPVHISGPLREEIDKERIELVFIGNKSAKTYKHHHINKDGYLQINRCSPRLSRQVTSRSRN